VGFSHRLGGERHLEASDVPHEDVRDTARGLLETWRMLRGVLKGVPREEFGSPVKPLKDHTPVLYTKALHRLVESLR
jgi:hypothetical protein